MSGDTRTHRKVKGKNGRPTSLTPQIFRTVIKYIRNGSYVETAAAATGIHKDTFYEWLKRGAADLKAGNEGSIYVRFSDAILKAQAKAEMDALNRIAKAGAINWQADAWRLERKFPQRYGRMVRIADGDDANPSQKSFGLNYSLDDDEEEKK